VVPLYQFVLSGLLIGLKGEMTGSAEVYPKSLTAFVYLFINYEIYPYLIALYTRHDKRLFSPNLPKHLFRYRFSARIGCSKNYDVLHDHSPLSLPGFLDF
jgi:hypothetical protein